MQCTGERNLADLEKESCAWQIITEFFFEGIEAGGQGEWSQYSITRSLKQVHQNVISNSMEERCHGGKRGPHVD